MRIRICRICQMLVFAGNCSGAVGTHHADEEPRLLRGAADTSVTNDANSKASSETSKTDRETRAELNEALV